MGWLKSYEPNVPVSSIGNLTTGGTGKTPIVVEIARGLIQAGKTVVVLSRGYGAAEPLAYGRALDPSHGDEAYMIQDQVPEAIVIVGRDRVDTLAHAVRDYRPDYVLLDDGFQYLRLKRIMNILLIDGARLLGNGHLLPVGPMREPLSQIARADLIFLTKTVSKEAMQTVEGWLQQYAPKKLQSLQVMPVEFQPVGLRALSDFRLLNKHPIPFNQFEGRPVIAFSAVAQSEQFERDLQAQGLTLLRHFAFADHHVYSERDVAKLVALYQAHKAEQPILVTTDKDLPKVRPMLPVTVHDAVYTLQMQPNLEGRWFYDEFLTQMPGLVGKGTHVQSSGSSR
jgi:tetraacyldisaccharide 4'-kinase